MNGEVIVCGFGKSNPFGIKGKACYDKRIELRDAINNLYKLSGYSESTAILFEDKIVSWDSISDIVTAEVAYFQHHNIDWIIVHIDHRCPGMAAIPELRKALEALLDRFKRGGPYYGCIIILPEEAKSLRKYDNLSFAFDHADILSLMQQIIVKLDQGRICEVTYTDEEFAECRIISRTLRHISPSLDKDIHNFQKKRLPNR